MAALPRFLPTCAAAAWCPPPRRTLQWSTGCASPESCRPPRRRLCAPSSSCTQCRTCAAAKRICARAWCGATLSGWSRSSIGCYPSGACPSTRRAPTTRAGACAWAYASRRRRRCWRASHSLRHRSRCTSPSPLHTPHGSSGPALPHGCAARRRVSRRAPRRHSLKTAMNSPPRGGNSKPSCSIERRNLDVSSSASGSCSRHAGTRSTRRLAVGPPTRRRQRVLWRTATRMRRGRLNGASVAPLQTVRRLRQPPTATAAAATTTAAAEAKTSRARLSCTATCGRRRHCTHASYL